MFAFLAALNYQENISTEDKTRKHYSEPA